MGVFFFFLCWIGVSSLLFQIFPFEIPKKDVVCMMRRPGVRWLLSSRPFQIFARNHSTKIAFFSKCLEILLKIIILHGTQVL
mmetsp:Transcript_4297/g.9679  ORF Transcript_4297/g.9679 Transcript_4297/m.9679 type:complete len:82 (-) Transcript_4297:356-601(-)